MRKFRTIKLFQFHKPKTCWTERFWSIGIMSNVWGHFFCFGGQNFFYKDILVSALRNKMKLKNTYKFWILHRNCPRTNLFYNVCFIKFRSECSINTVLSLLQNSMEQTLQYSINYTQGLTDLPNSGGIFGAIALCPLPVPTALHLLAMRLALIFEPLLMRPGSAMHKLKNAKYSQTNFGLTY